MKMTLDQLRVDSYATQVSEYELTEVKGGTTPVCVWLGITAAEAVYVALIAGAATVAVAAISQPDDNCVEVTTTDSNGCVTGTVTTCTTYN